MCCNCIIVVINNNTALLLILSLQALLRHHVEWGRSLLPTDHSCPPDLLFVEPDTGRPFAFTSSHDGASLPAYLQKSVDDLGFAGRLDYTSMNARFFFVDHAEKGFVRYRMSEEAKEAERAQLAGLMGTSLEHWKKTYANGSEGRNLNAAAAAAAVTRCFGPGPSSAPPEALPSP